MADDDSNKVPYFPTESSLTEAKNQRSIKASWFVGLLLIFAGLGVGMWAMIGVIAQTAADLGMGDIFAEPQLIPVEEFYVGQIVHVVTAGEPDQYGNLNRVPFFTELSTDRAPYKCKAHSPELMVEWIDASGFTQQSSGEHFVYGGTSVEIIEVSDCLLDINRHVDGSTPVAFYKVQFIDEENAFSRPFYWDGSMAYYGDGSTDTVFLGKSAWMRSQSLTTIAYKDMD